MPRSFFLWKEVKTNSFNSNEASTKQPTIEKQNRNMKTIILMTAMFLAVAFAGPLAATEPTHIRGYILADQTSQVVGNTLIVDVSGSGSYTFGACTFTYHAKVNLTTLSSQGTARFTSPNGDTLSTTTVGQSTDTGIGELYVTELHTVTGGTGGFAGADGHFTLERLLDLESSKTYGWFNGTIGLN
jgi:FlaG/FlaF family flagellin (archaellin)